ncbi:MAG: hypothetical protein ABI162_08850 [Luteolibacter sp.]
MAFLKREAFFLVVGLALAGPVKAIIFLETGDITHNTSTPGDNSGWQYEGKFHEFLGVPIAPFYFITAQHIGGNIGDVFDFHGDSYTTIGVQNIPSTDLRVWEVNHTKPFPTYSPVSSGIADHGATAAMFGRGTQRGSEVIVSGESKGWQWGPGDAVERWGRNTVANVSVFDPGLGEFLYCDFDNPGVADECHLSAGDSGGGMFVLENGLWRLAGINYAVDGPFRIPPAGASFMAALYDCGGLEYQNGPNWVPVTEGAQNVPSSFYCSRVSASLPWIRTNVGLEVDSLASESFPAWQKLYFTPTEIANPAISGPLADPDGDDIGNLLEFALNLDPTFNERTAMIPGAGLRGLPSARLETDVGERLTMEFVRRTTGSGAGLTYIPEFSSDLSDWQAVGTEAVTSLNSRWERVKITDFLTTNDSPIRFVRLRAVLSE